MNDLCSVTGSTKIYLLVGSSIQKSLSPIIHNAAFCHFGFNAVYVPIVIPSECNNEKQLKAILEMCRVSNIDGMNITMPFKSRVIKYLDQCDTAAELIGAVNTIVKSGGNLLGFNTDAYGFGYGLKSSGIDVKGSRCLVLGAGGAAKAVIYALNEEEVDSIAIAVRNLNSIKELEKITKAINKDNNKTEIVFQSIAGTSFKNYDLIVNATPVGMYGYERQFEACESEFTANQIFYDLVYTPQDTELILKAKESGATIISGLSMLVGQAIKSFEIWTGTKPDSNVMYEAIEKMIRRA